jgi:peroxiredoxin
MRQPTNDEEARMTTITPSIAEQANAVKVASAARLPPSVLATFAAQQAELVAAGVPADVAAVGTALTDVPLLDAHGATTSLHAVTASRPTVLAFYRGGWCPYCSLTLRTYSQALLPELNRHGVGLAAISPQTPDGSLSTQETNELPFAVLSDPGNALARALGILMPARPEVSAAQRQLGLDLTAVNADGSETLPMPTVVVLDAESTIRWIDVHPDYTTRSEVTDILAAVTSTL